MVSINYDGLCADSLWCLYNDFNNPSLHDFSKAFLLDSSSELLCTVPLNSFALRKMSWNYYLTLETNKVNGPDNISAKMLKAIAISIDPVLSKFLNSFGYHCQATKSLENILSCIYSKN